MAGIGVGIGTALDGMVLTGLRAIVECAGGSLVLVIVMAEVLGGLVLLVSPIVGHRSPGSLEWKQAQHKKHENTFHG